MMKNWLLRIVICSIICGLAAVGANGTAWAYNFWSNGVWTNSQTGKAVNSGGKQQQVSGGSKTFASPASLSSGQQLAAGNAYQKASTFTSSGDTARLMVTLDTKVNALVSTQLVADNKSALVAGAFNALPTDRAAYTMKNMPAVAAAIVGNQMDTGKLSSVMGSTYLNAGEKAQIFNQMDTAQVTQVMGAMAKVDVGQVARVLGAMAPAQAGAVMTGLYKSQATSGGMDLATQILANPKDMQLDQAYDILNSMPAEDAKAIVQNIDKQYPAAAIKYGDRNAILNSHGYMIATGSVIAVEDPAGSGQYYNLPNENFNPRTAGEYAVPDAGGNVIEVPAGVSASAEDGIRWSASSHLQDGIRAVDLDDNAYFDVFKSAQDAVEYRPSGMREEFRNQYKVINNVLLGLTNENKWEPVVWPQNGE